MVWQLGKKRGFKVRDVTTCLLLLRRERLEYVYSMMQWRKRG
jgi:hypothetical protein